MLSQPVVAPPATISIITTSVAATPPFDTTTKSTTAATPVDTDTIVTYATATPPAVAVKNDIDIMSSNATITSTSTSTAISTTDKRYNNKHNGSNNIIMDHHHHHHHRSRNGETYTTMNNNYTESTEDLIHGSSPESSNNGDTGSSNRKIEQGQEHSSDIAHFDNNNYNDDDRNDDVNDNNNEHDDAVSTTAPITQSVTSTNGLLHRSNSIVKRHVGKAAFRQNFTKRVLSGSRFEMFDHSSSNNDIMDVNHNNHNNNNTTAAEVNCNNNTRYENDKARKRNRRFISKSSATKYRLGIITVSFLVFAILFATGMSLIGYNIANAKYTKSTEVTRLAIDTGEFFANELEKATLPLFSLAQFATEIDLFSDLPPQIGQAGLSSSLPSINTTDGRIFRNVTGVCDNRTLIERFNKISQTATTNAKLGDVLHNMQFAPFGVLCLSSPLVYVDPNDGKVLNNSGAIGYDLLNDSRQRYIARESLKNGTAISIVGPRALVQCPDCGLYFIVRIPIISATNIIEIDGENYYRWGFATALIQWEKLIDRSQIREMFAMDDKDFQLTRTDRLFNATTNQYDVQVVILAQSESFDLKMGRKEVTHLLQTTNNEWQIVIQYSDSTNWQGWAIMICIFVSVCISFLTYVVLVQKQNQAIYKGESMIQEAKVDIERNMTAYFAHELRNPLSAIDSAILSMPDNLPDEARELLRGMQLCSTFMSSIMNNLLDVRKMEEGKLVMRTEPFSLSNFVSNIYTMVLPTVHAGVELISIAETEGRDWVLGDMHRLEQIMYNLISNAIKYTRVGSITVYVGWDDNDSVRLECRDTGPGIPKDEQANMFERFTQRGGAPGSGLGLAIAKNLVTLMKGDVHFDSDPTVRPGTTCIVLLPLPICSAPVETEDDIGKLTHLVPIQEPLRILIVDDIKMNRNLLRRRFEKSISPNCIITESCTGEETVELCQAPKAHEFDVIIMDQYMHEAGGVMLGTDTIIALRRMKVESYIIGCSGNDLDEKFYTAGADLIWKKPLPSNYEIIQQLRSAMNI